MSALKRRRDEEDVAETCGVIRDEVGGRRYQRYSVTVAADGGVQRHVVGERTVLRGTQQHGAGRTRGRTACAGASVPYEGIFKSVGNVRGEIRGKRQERYVLGIACA